jgi:hypothetical protein
VGLAQQEPIEWEPAGFPTVIAFDPGGTTGWAVITVHPDALEDPDVPILENILHWDQGQIVGDEHSQVDHIIEMLDLWDGAAVLFEDFELRTMAAELSPVRITNTVSWALTRLFDPPRNIFLQMPAMAMTTATDARLRRWKLYRPGQEHARDATRHAIVFLRRAKQAARMRAAAFPHAYAS